MHAPRIRRRLFFVVCGVVSMAAALSPARAQSENQSAETQRPGRPPIPRNFLRQNLVAWCIVPFDSEKRSPEERAQMLRDLGLKRCAYDWRDEHVPLFEREIKAYRAHGIELVAFWKQHPAAFRLFEKHELQPQVWFTLPSPDVDGQAAKIDAAVAQLTPLVERCAALHCKLGLYNHGGWGGEPENLVAVCQALRAAGHDHVGIVYNLHHGHGHIDDFAEALQSMTPFLLCLNLNGMVDLREYADRPEKQRALKIQPIGRGQFEREMIQTVIASGYAGPIGVLGHVATRDVAQVLRENMEGLEYVLGARPKPGWLTQLEQAE